VPDTIFKFDSDLSTFMGDDMLCDVTKLIAVLAGDLVKDVIILEILHGSCCVNQC